MICTVKTLTNFAWLGCFCAALLIVIPPLAYATPGEVQVDEPIEEHVKAKGDAAAPKVSSSEDADDNHRGRSDLDEDDEDEILMVKFTRTTVNSPRTSRRHQSLQAPRARAAIEHGISWKGWRR